MKPIYYETHITIGGDNLDIEMVKVLAKGHGYRCSSFTNGPDYERPKETILTAKSLDLERLEANDAKVLNWLEIYKIKVLRYKIEAAIKDTKPLDQHKGFL